MSDLEIDPEEVDEVYLEAILLVGEWLLVEKCRKKIAVRRLRDAAGSKSEAQAMVTVVHALLVNAIGWGLVSVLFSVVGSV